MANKSAAAKAAKERDIDATLADLNINTGATAQEAAEAAADETAEEVAFPDPNADPPSVNAASEDSSEGEPPATTVEVEEVEVRIPSPVLPAAMTEAAPALVPPPKVEKLKRQLTATSASKMGKGIAEKAPGAEKVIVYKRQEDGQRWHVRDYNKADLTGHPNFESFINRWVKPKYGAGEYDIVGMTAAGGTMELGSVRLMETPGAASPEQGAMSLAQTALADLKELRAQQEVEWKKRVEETMNAPVDPIAMLSGMIDVQQKMTPEIAPANTGVDPVMQMFMAQSAQQSQMVMALLTKPKDEDPIMKLLLAKLMEDGGLGGGGAAPPPPPLPPPAESPASMLTAMAGFMQVMNGGGGEPSPPAPDAHSQFLEQMLLAKQSDGMSMKEVIQLLLAKDSKPGSDDFRTSVDNMAAVMNIATNMNRQTEGGGSATFFDSLGALFSNRDFTGSLANAVRTKTQQAATRTSGATPAIAPPQQQQRPPANAAEAVARIDQEQQRLAQHQRALYANKQQILAAANQTPPSTAATQPAVVPGAPAGAVQAAPTPPSQVVQQQAPPAQTPPTQGVPTPGEEVARIPILPSTTPDYVNRLAAAEDDGGIVSEAVAFFIHLGEHEQWREFMETLLGHIRSGNKPVTLEYLNAFFNGLAHIGVVEPRIAQATISAIDRNFPEMERELGDLRLDGDEFVSGAQLLSPNPDGGELAALVDIAEGPRENDGETGEETEPPDGEGGGDGENAS